MVTKADQLSHEFRQPDFKKVRLSQSIVAGMTAAMDVAILLVSAALIYLVYVAPTEVDSFAVYAGATAFWAFVLVQAYLASGMYRFSAIIKPSVHMRRLMLIPAGIALILITVTFALKISEEFSRVWTFTLLGVTMLLIPAARFGSSRILRRLSGEGVLGRNIIVYGSGKQAEALIRHIESTAEPWNHIVGVFDDRNTRREEQVAGYPVLGGLDSLIDWARTHRTDEVLVALPWSAADRLVGIANILASLPVDIRLSPEFVGADFLHRPTNFQFGIPMLTLLNKPVTGWSAIMKKGVDFGFASLFTLLSLPFLGLIAIAIKLDSPGPVLFRQQRCGFNHQLIGVYKFRTMFVDQTDHDAKQLTRPNDPRVTRVGAILRRFSLDELPQLFNVLKGDMSLVGPRPHALQAKAGNKLYEDVIDEYAVRHKVKPGLTGWAQVNGWRGNTETEDDLLGRVEHDLFYIENWSISLDLVIIARTFLVVLGGKNSH